MFIYIQEKDFKKLHYLFSIVSL